jgi:hypothetical protein
MAITNTWSVVSLDAYPEFDGETDVVFTVHWTLNGTDGTYNGSVYGSSAVLLNEGGTFVPYADLTEAQVIGWVQDALGEEAVAGFEASVAKQIEDQANPPVVHPALPWGA